MSEDQFAALMPLICSDLIRYISEKQKISYKEAIEKLYSSKLYSLLEEEETKVWHYSTPMLYSLLEQEETNGTISFPDT